MIDYRPAMSVDRNFVTKAWLASWRDSNTAGMVSVDTWFEVMTPQITARLSWPGVQTVVAYETSNPDHSSNAYGFIVADVTQDTPLIFYVYTKSPYRRSGIARGLFQAIGVNPEGRWNFVCHTPVATELERKIPMARWTPRLGRFPKSERRKAG